MLPLRRLAAALLGLAVLTTTGCGAPAARSAQTASADTLFARSAEPAAVVIRYQTRGQLAALAKVGVAIEGLDRPNKRFRTTLTREQFEVARRLGLSVTQDLGGGRNDYDPKYRTYAQTAQALRALAAKLPGRAEVVDVGDSWEKTQQKADRDLLALHLGQGGTGKPVVLFAGCHHARELATPEVVLLMAQHLVEGYGKDAEVTGLLDTRDIWLVPMVNPDGHARAEKGADQRKNTNNVTGGKGRIGVDLNRNYGGPSWGQVGTSSNPESDTFGGRSGFSEPETQAMRDLMRRIRPTYLLTFHSYSNMVLWPWGYTDEPPPDPRLALVGKKLGELSGYEVGQSGPALYPTAGDDTDWAFAELGTLAYTVEIGGWSDGFDPPYSSVARFWDENRPMMLYTLRTADNPAAAAGPEVVRQRTGPRPVAAEYFLGQPGPAGSGQPSAPGAAPVVAVGARTLVWSHARDGRGTWGPWTITWSR
ncbi:MAG: M14 family metallopeptidase [Candidatus Sericytochromatia bacterium]|nr:M14 family metallopeptidase [Candidatus Sericytochromatia bacterium]